MLLFMQKMKYDLFQKKFIKIYSRNVPKGRSSQKIALEYDVSYIMRKDGISFSQKHNIFFTDGKLKMIFLKKYIEI